MTMLLRRRALMGGEKARDYSKEYLTFEALEAGTFTLTIPANISTTIIPSVSYSTDGGATWVTTQNVDSTQVVITTPTIQAGGKVLWKSVSQTLSATGNANSRFSSTCEFNVYGNSMSLFYGDDYIGKTVWATTNSYKMTSLFSASKVVNAANLIMPATTLVTECYSMMFYNCASLTAAPELPATTLTKGCYKAMFSSCTSLIDAPELPATMLVENCYSTMLSRCLSLQYIKMLATDISAANCLTNWVMFIPSGGTFVKDTSMTSLPTGWSGIPDGWTVIDE